jgi:hypothetical protein
MVLEIKRDVVDFSSHFYQEQQENLSQYKGWDELPGFDSLPGKVLFSAPDRLEGPTSLLSSWYRGSFHGDKKSRA